MTKHPASKITDGLTDALNGDFAIVHERGAGGNEAFQSEVARWMEACFGLTIMRDKLERGDRFLEEALELLQSGDYPPERITALVNYVYGRPKGEPYQEVGGVMVTLAAYCWAHDLPRQAAGDTELARVWTKIEKIRAKQAAKPTGSALPVLQAATGAPVSPAADLMERMSKALEDMLSLRDEGLRGVSLGGELSRVASARSALADYNAMRGENG